MNNNNNNNSKNIYFENRKNLKVHQIKEKVKVNKQHISVFGGFETELYFRTKQDRNKTMRRRETNPKEIKPKLVCCY